MPQVNPSRTSELRLSKARRRSREFGLADSARSTLARLNHDAKPFLLGVGVGFTLAVVAVKRPRRPLALFPAPRSLLVRIVVRAALLAAGRVLLRRIATRSLVTTA